MDLEKIQYYMQRYEKKFLITEAQYERLLPLLEEHMRPDIYGCYEGLNLYYDTDDYAIIRSCLDRPYYKEKFRVRSYGIPEPDGMVFAEIKKKFRGVTYKRRVNLPLSRLPDFLSGNYVPDGQEQTAREILWFWEHNLPIPKVFLCYDREPYEEVEESNLRITFDRNIRWRTDHLNLTEGSCGTPLIASESVLMEVKTSAAIPLWLVRFLSEEHILSTGFSKYGTCYTNYILPTLTERKNYHADQSL